MPLISCKNFLTVDTLFFCQMVHFHAHGLCLNPNLYSSGDICLSLLDTWLGSPDERWIPDKSTMLQVLISLQALVLNAKPLFNEDFPTEMFKGVDRTEDVRKYNEAVFTASLRMMQCIIKNPPQVSHLILGRFILQCKIS